LTGNDHQGNGLVISLGLTKYIDSCEISFKYTFQGQIYGAGGEGSALLSDFTIGNNNQTGINSLFISYGSIFNSIESGIKTTTTLRDFKILISSFNNSVTVENNKVYDDNIGPLPIITCTKNDRQNSYNSMNTSDAGVKVRTFENYDLEKQLYFNFQLGNYIANSNYYLTLTIQDLKIIVNSNNPSALQASTNNIYSSN
jgi:hypothetical protein